MPHDVIIIGAGHNGLVTAAYLAKAGKRVLVLERRHVIGGTCVTEELWPGFKMSTAAYVVSLFLPELVCELKLDQYGYRVLPRNPSSFTPLPDGRHLLLGPDPKLNHEQIAKFSPRDADAYPRYETQLSRVAEWIEPLLTATPPNIPLTGRRTSLGRKLRDATQTWRLLRSLPHLGTDLPTAIRLLTGAARPILDRWFESDCLKATLATDAIIGTQASISDPGTAYVLLHHVMGRAGGAHGVWGYIQGGPGALTQALGRAGEELGVEIRTEASVAEIAVEAGRARGVVLEDGTELRANSVVSNADANVTFLKMLGNNALPTEFREQVQQIDYASASMKINVALSELPNFTALPGTEAGPQHQGTIHIGPSLDYLERAFDGVHRGVPSDEPILELTLPSAVDSTISPPGQHVMSMFVQYAPYKLAEGTWDDRKETFADRCIELIGRYAPNVPGAVLHRQVVSPLDLERTFGLTGGNIFQGSMGLGQMFSFRPLPGWADYRTPINGLYLCGAATHPGGGIMGACGRNAAIEILRDIG